MRTIQSPAVRSMHGGQPRLSLLVSAITVSQNRRIILTTLGLLGVTLVLGAVWHFGWSPHDLAEPANQVPCWLVVSTVIFIAASLSSTVGFAFSAIAAAMIFHFVSETIEAVQIMMVASIGIQAYSVASLRSSISWRTCAPFVIGGVMTMPLGIYFLLTLRPQAYIFAIGMGLVLYGAYLLFRQPPSARKAGVFADVAVGALGGITGPLVAFPGAFITIWCGMRGWNKVAQRAVYQPYILILQVLSLGALTVVGGRSMLNASAIVYMLPSIAGAYLGMRMFQRLSDAQFQRIVTLALILSGIALIFK